MTLVGTNVEMVGGRAKVSGAVSYVADMEFTGQLYAKALRSPYPHAKLLRIDASKAAALRGVRAVVTRDDLAGLNPILRHRRRRSAGAGHRQSALRRRHRCRGSRRQPRDRRRGGGADRGGLPRTAGSHRHPRSGQGRRTDHSRPACRQTRRRQHPRRLSGLQR